jgi:hypothetical protein
MFFKIDSIVYLHNFIYKDRPAQFTQGKYTRICTEKTALDHLVSFNEMKLVIGKASCAWGRKKNGCCFSKKYNEKGQWGLDKRLGKKALVL